MTYCQRFWFKMAENLIQFEYFINMNFNSKNKLKLFDLSSSERFKVLYIFIEVLKNKN